MAKFLKSIFHTTERRKPNHYEHEGDEEKSGDSPQMGSRRQLSISRSGRMRQANKKRHSLTLELYGETIHIDAVEKPQSIEYHVHSQNHSAPAVLEGSNTRFDTAEVEDKHTKEISKEVLNNFETKVNNVKTPEEEIDNAFDVIDKS